MNPYTVLGVAKSATAAEIKKAYRAKAKELHPDQPEGNEAKFKELNEAYDVLKDEDKREQYDLYGSAQPQPRSTRPGGSGFNQHWTWQRYQGDPFNDPFMTARRSGMGDAGARSAANNISSNIGIPLVTMIRGGKVQIQIQSPKMHGTSQGGFMQFSMETHTLEFTLDPMTPVGKTVVLTASDHNIEGLDRVTLLVFPETDGKGNYRIEQLDIHMGIKVDAFDALVGRQIEIDLPTSEQIRLTLPAGINTGKTIRLAGKGLADLGGNLGDVYLVVSLYLPELTPEQKQQISDIIYPDEG